MIQHAAHCVESPALFGASVCVRGFRLVVGGVGRTRSGRCSVLGSWQELSASIPERGCDLSHSVARHRGASAGLTGHDNRQWLLLCLV